MKALRGYNRSSADPDQPELASRGQLVDGRPAEARDSAGVPYRVCESRPLCRFCHVRLRLLRTGGMSPRQQIAVEIRRNYAADSGRLGLLPRLRFGVSPLIFALITVCFGCALRHMASSTVCGRSFSSSVGHRLRARLVGAHYSHVPQWSGSPQLEAVCLWFAGKSDVPTRTSEKFAVPLYRALSQRRPMRLPR